MPRTMDGLSRKQAVERMCSVFYGVVRMIEQAVGFVFILRRAAQKIMLAGFGVPSTRARIEGMIP